MTIQITEHARQRLNERLPEIHPKNYQNFLIAARTHGVTFQNLWRDEQLLAKALKKKMPQIGSENCRIYRDCVFFFGKNPSSKKTLITVVRIPRKVLEKCAFAGEWHFYGTHERLKYSQTIRQTI